MYGTSTVHVVSMTAADECVNASLRSGRLVAIEQRIVYTSRSISARACPGAGPRPRGASRLTHFDHCGRSWCVDPGNQLGEGYDVSRRTAENQACTRRGTLYAG